MGQQVGEAFVRIRPNMSGFKSETETGVKSSFSSLAKIAGLAFGGAAVGALVKSSVESAGRSEAITSSVRAQFGKLGNSVLDFASKQGAAFGSLEANTNQTSYALGKLFINAGASTKQAAMMTTQWEKLGLALNQARGGGVAGATESLRVLETVAAGTSTRGLRQLGITVTSQQIALKAAADGFIRLGQSAASLTPAQKQLVTFQLAMRRLPDALREAALVSQGFTAVQARLAVAWDNAKTALGTALIPLLTRGATAMTNWLTRMERSGRLQHDFNQVASVTAYIVGAIKDVINSGIHVWEGFTSAVGGSKNALIALASAFALVKVGGIGKAATKDAEAIGSRIGSTFTNIRNRAKASAHAMAQDYSTASKRIVAQTDAMKKAGNTWSTQAASNASKVKTATSNVGGSFGALDKAMKTTSQSAKTNTGAMNQAFNSFAANTKKQAGGFKGAITRASAASATAFEVAATGMKAAAIEVGATIKVALIQTGIGLLIVAIGILVGWVITHWDTVKKYTLALAHATVEAFKGMGNIITGVYQYVYGKVLYYVVDLAKKILDNMASAFGWVPFVGGKLKEAARAVDGFAASVNRFAENGRNRIVGGFGEISHGVTKAWNDSLAKSSNDAKVNDNAKKSGKKVAQSMMDGATTAITAMAPSVQKAISTALQNAVAAAHKAIAASVRAAKNNLDKIGQDLAKTIYDIQTKIGGAAGAVAGSPQGAAFAKLKKLIESGAPAFQIQKAQAELAGQLQNVGKTQKQQLSSQLSNLTAAFNQGKIGYREFEARLHKILREDGITMAQALKAGGPAFRDAFKAQVDALGKQARAIAALPAKYRGVGGAGGAADIRIIQPLQVIKQEQMKVRTAVEKAAQAAQKQRAAILKNQQKQIALQQEAKSVGARIVFNKAQSGVRTTRDRFSAVIAAHTRRTADNTDPRHYRAPAGPRGPGRGRPQVASRSATPSQSAAVAHSLTSSFSAMAQNIAHLRPDLQGIRSAIQNEQAVLLRGLREVCADIAAADKDIVAAELGLHSPLENLRRTELRIGEHAAQQRDRQIRLQHQTNTLLTRLNRDKGVPGFNKERPGTGSKSAAAAARAGVKP